MIRHISTDGQQRQLTMNCSPSARSEHQHLERSTQGKEGNTPLHIPGVAIYALA